MMIRLKSGQEAIEFVLITVLVFFGALFTVMVFGEKISAYFTSGSSMAQSANKTVAKIDTGPNQKFNPDYDTYVEYEAKMPVKVSEPTISEDGTTLMLGDLALNVPEDMFSAISTSGSSGATDHLTSSMTAIIADLKNIAEANPEDSNLQKMLSISQQMSTTGHLVADAEEWYETAARRLESNSSLEIPEDNRLCESGHVTDNNRNCDHTTSNQSFIYNQNSTLEGLLQKQVRDLEKLENQLASLSSDYDDPKIVTITNSIDVLSEQIRSIADTVQKSINKNKKEIKSLQDLKDSVASKATDVRSALIKRYKEKMAKYAEEDKPVDTTDENVANEPETNDLVGGDKNAEKDGVLAK